MYDRFPGLGRIAQLVPAGFLPRFPDGGEQVVVVGDGPRGARHGPSGPVGAEGAGLDRRHMDPELRDLLAQRLEDAFQSELAAAVGGHAGHGHEPAHRRDGHQVSAAARAHVGQRRLQGGHRPEHVDVELPPHLGQRGFLEGSLQAVAGVGDDDVQRTDAPLDLRDHAVNGATVRHVQDAAVGVPGSEFFEGPHVVLGADGADHGVPGGQGGLRESAPQAGADAGDEPVLPLHCSSSEVLRGAGTLS